MPLRLHKYLGGTINGLDARSEGVGGTADHAHLLVSLKSPIAWPISCGN